MDVTAKTTARETLLSKKSGEEGLYPGFTPGWTVGEKHHKAASVPRLLRPSLAGGAAQIVCLKPDVHLK